MSSNTITACLLATVATEMMAQYRGDYARYDIISIEELPSELKALPGALLLDVRSPGEYEDTSSYSSLNLGRLKGSMNIPIDSITLRYADLVGYKDRPVVVYCSHSQRSRRVCNQLADSGFTKLINVNAGLSRFWYDHHLLPSMRDLVERTNPNELLSAVEFCEHISSGAMVVDLRPDSIYGPMATDEAHRSLGVIRGALHVPIAELDDRIGEITKGVPILLVDESGSDAPQAAALLRQHGWSDVHVLFGGLETLRDVTSDHFPCASTLLDRPIRYGILPIEKVDREGLVAGKYALVDVRSSDEYNGKSKQPWLNVGRLRSSMNVPLDELRQGTLQQRVKKDAEVLVMGRDPNEYYEAARLLCGQGYAHVTVLDGGIWGLRWSAHNMAGNERLEELYEPPPTSSK